MVQKIIQIGNSTGIIIPKNLMNSLGFKPGVEVSIEEDTQHKTLTVSKKGVKIARTSITPYFLNILDKVNKQYGKALKELAQK